MRICRDAIDRRYDGEMGRWECKEHADEVKGRGRGERGERREERADVCWGSRDEAETRQIEETTVVGKGNESEE